MSDSRALVQALFERSWVAGLPPGELVAGTYAVDAPGMRGLTGPQALTSLIASYRTAFSDFTLTVARHLADGESVVTEFTLTGRHTGRWDGVRATHRSIDVPGCAFTHLTDARISRQWYEWDRRRMLEQLKVMPRV
jgi:steroid delta-isomerase-like uncharacterized protein